MESAKRVIAQGGNLNATDAVEVVSLVLKNTFICAVALLSFLIFYFDF